MLERKKILKNISMLLVISITNNLTNITFAYFFFSCCKEACTLSMDHHCCYEMCTHARRRVCESVYGAGVKSEVNCHNWVLSFHHGYWVPVQIITCAVDCFFKGLAISWVNVTILSNKDQNILWSRRIWMFESYHSPKPFRTFHFALELVIGIYFFNL